MKTTSQSAEKLWDMPTLYITIATSTTKMVSTRIVSYEVHCKMLMKIAIYFGFNSWQ